MSCPAERVFENVFCFESYGVSVSLESNSSEILSSAEATARKALLQNLRPCGREAAVHVFRFEMRADGDCTIFQDGKEMVTGSPNWGFFRYFDSLVRILVAEFARSHVFIHAGVVGWKNKAILVPANSFFGKTSLVAEFIRAGAVYYSDEYAVLDNEGLVHPFARKLSLRDSAGRKAETDVDPLELGAVVGHEPIPVGIVWYTKYDPSVRLWQPERQSIGNAIVEMLNYTIPIRRNPAFAMDVLRKSLEGSTVIKCARGDVSEFVPFFMDFVDNTVI